MSRRSCETWEARQLQRTRDAIRAMIVNQAPELAFSASAHTREHPSDPSTALLSVLAQLNQTAKSP